MIDHRRVCLVAVALCIVVAAAASAQDARNDGDPEFGARDPDLGTSTARSSARGLDRQRLTELNAVRSRTTAAKADFVAALRRFVERLWVESNDHSTEIRSAVDDMSRALDRWDTAIEEYRHQLAAVSDGADAHVALGTTYLDRGLLSQAVDEFRRAKAVASGSGEASFFLALAYAAQGKVGESARALTDAARAAPASAAIAYARVQQAVLTGDEHAISRALLEFRDQRDRASRAPVASTATTPFVRLGLFRETAGTAPVFAPALYAEGFQLLDAFRYADAVAAFRRSLDRESTGEQARVALAERLMATGDSGSAERELMDVVASLPESGLAHYRLARLYQSQSRAPEALAAFVNASTRRIVVGRDFLYETIAVLRTGDGQFSAAIEAYRHEIEVNPNNAPAHRRVGDLYAQDGRLQEALAEFAAALLIDPADADTHVSRAQALLRLGRFADAEAAARTAVEMSPGHEAARYALGTALMRLGRVDDGQATLQEFERLYAATRARNDAQWQLKLLKDQAFERANRQDYHGAAELLQRAVAFAPPDGSVQLAAGAFFAKAREYEPALALLKDALTHNALEAHRYLAEVYAALGRDADSRMHAAAYEELTQARTQKKTTGSAAFP